MSDDYIPPAEATAARWLHPIHPDGRKFIVIFAVMTLVFAWCAWETLAWPMGAVTIWAAAFFRDPKRVTPRGQGLITAPADGLITLITTVPPPREMVGEGGLDPAPVVRVSIFMSVFDVHINRAPIAGTIRRVVYISGKFLNADLDKASEDNERQHILMETGDGLRIGFTQIAGLVARRIVPFVKPGDIVAAGQRVGLIRFGSRVDVYLPAHTQPLVCVGQRTVAGETVLARVGHSDKATGVAQ
ncbi:MAG: phosphatidylserine decarboxylase [Sphingomonadaceae bacterium]|nr:phosphatidylserine decarboxylase [Sphingomonadaceae bacterium]